MVNVYWLQHVVQYAQVTPEMVQLIARLKTPQYRAPWDETVLPCWEHRLVEVVKIVGSYGNLLLDMVESMNACEQSKRI